MARPGRDTGSTFARSATASGRRARHSNISRRVGSPNACSAIEAFVMTYGKYILTYSSVATPFRFFYCHPERSIDSRMRR